MATNESWRPVPGYETAYEISTWGRLRSKDRIVYHGVGGLMAIKGRAIAMYKIKNRYKVYLMKRGTKRLYDVARLVLQTFGTEPMPDRYFSVRFLNGDRSDFRLENLRWVTRR